MNKIELEYLHPYFMSAEWYFIHGRRKAEFVFIKEIKNGWVSVVIYNQDRTAIVDESAWHLPEELTDGYDVGEWYRIAQDLENMWVCYDIEKMR